MKVYLKIQFIQAYLLLILIVCVKPAEIVRNFLATCSPGLAKPLQREILTLRSVGDVKISSGGVEFSGTSYSGLDALMWLRSPLRLMECISISTEPINSRDSLYAFANRIQWESMIDPLLHSIKCDCVIGDRVASDLCHSHFSALTIKNAIVDRFRNLRSTRPSVNLGKPTLPLHLYLHNDQAFLYRVWSGADSLHKRGYRRDLAIHKAALRDTTAAAVLLASGWDQQGFLLDPMCGGASIVIEAALLLANTAPGLLRFDLLNRRPCALDWLDCAQATQQWQDVWHDAIERDRRRLLQGELLWANDCNPQALNIAKLAAEKAGVDHLIRFTGLTARELVDHYAQSWLKDVKAIVTNPPWDRRLDQSTVKAWQDLSPLFSLVLAQQPDSALAVALCGGNNRLIESIHLPKETFLSTDVGDVRIQALRFHTPRPRIPSRSR